MSVMSVIVCSEKLQKNLYHCSICLLSDPDIQKAHKVRSVCNLHDSKAYGHLNARLGLEMRLLVRMSGMEMASYDFKLFTDSGGSSPRTHCLCQ